MEGSPGINFDIFCNYLETLKFMILFEIWYLDFDIYKGILNNI